MWSCGCLVPRDFSEGTRSMQFKKNRCRVQSYTKDLSNEEFLDMEGNHVGEAII